jgi:probable HAF family extracellular repeat protein
MTTFLRRSAPSLALSLGLLLLAAEASSGQNYTATDLGTLPGGNNSFGNGIDASGHVTGFADVPNNQSCCHAFAFRDGKMLDLGTLPGGTGSFGYAISSRPRRERDDGVQEDMDERQRERFRVTGYAGTQGGNRAFLYRKGKMLNLGTLPGGKYSLGSGINQAGQVSGTSDTLGGTQHAFLYSKGKMLDLGTLPGGTESLGEAINEYGQVTGSADTAHLCCHTFIYSKGKMSDLGTLPGGSLSIGLAINRHGEITGYSDSTGVSGGDYHAFLYSNHTMKDLGTLPGISSTHGTGINRYAQVVGYADTAGNNFHAFLYRNGTLYDLNNLIPAGSGWVLQMAQAINDRGQITGFGFHDGKGRAFLLNPICSHDRDDREHGRDDDVCHREEQEQH